jgi:hypothetical protein
VEFAGWNHAGPAFCPFADATKFYTILRFSPFCRLAKKKTKQTQLGGSACRINGRSSLSNWSLAAGTMPAPPFALLAMRQFYTILRFPACFRIGQEKTKQTQLCGSPGRVSARSSLSNWSLAAGIMPAPPFALLAMRQFYTILRFPACFRIGQEKNETNPIMRFSM